MCRFGFFCFTFFLSTGLWAQSNVGGAAPVLLEVRAADCGLPARTVDVFVDVTGLIGNGGEAGINGFVLAFNLPAGNGFQGAAPGVDPMLDWTFAATETAASGGSLKLAGAVADLNAPNQRYHLASLAFDGADIWVTLEFDETASSLSSRVVNGDGPGPIPMTPPDPITFHLVGLSLGTGVSLWRQTALDYDLAPPLGTIDVHDLIALVNCSKGGR